MQGGKRALTGCPVRPHLLTLLPRPFSAPIAPTRSPRLPVGWCIHILRAFALASKSNGAGAQPSERCVSFNVRRQPCWFVRPCWSLRYLTGPRRALTINGIEPGTVTWAQQPRLLGEQSSNQSTNCVGGRFLPPSSFYPSQAHGVHAPCTQSTAEFETWGSEG